MNLQVSATIFGVPRSHWHCTLLNFDWPSEGVKNSVSLYLDRLESGERPNLLLTGAPGLGKTHLAVALYRWGVMHLGGTQKNTLIHVPQFFHEVKRGFNSRDDFESDPFLDLERVDGVTVLDDMLGRNPTQWELDNVIFRLINTAYTNKGALIATLNHSLDAIGEWLKPHEMSRLLNNTTHVVFQGKDRRL